MEYKSNPLQQESWKLQIDLAGDLENQAYQMLVRGGYHDADPKRALYQYYNLRKRIPESRKRTVHKSRQFVCPAGYEEALKNFEEKAEKGQTLLPYMSEKWKSASYNDDLLNDWGIYHFHLTNRFREDGTAKRSDYEILAHVTDNDLYMIQVYRHKGMEAYYKYELLEIIKENWPELLEPHQIKGVVSLSEQIGEQEYRKLREAHISSFVELKDKTVFGMIGGGYMSDGSSGDALRASDYWHRRMRQIQELIVSHMGTLSSKMRGFRADFPEASNAAKDYEIKLLWIDNQEKVTLCETNRGLIVQVNIAKGFFRICNPWEVFGYKT